MKETSFRSNWESKIITLCIMYSGQAMTTIIKKIPGLLPPPPKTEIDGKITDLSSKNLPELLELKDRQLKLINNKAFISKLPDRGEKIKLFYEKIISTLKEKEDEERTCHLFNKLNLSVEKQSVQDVEWEGKFKGKRNEYLDSDDDSDPEDVLHILSQSTSLEKKVRVLPPEKPLITTEDIKSITEPHIKYIVDKTESNPKSKPTGQFKPFKTTKSDVHNPEKEIHRKKHKNWEVTSATPPPIVHGPAKLLSLEESLKLQKDHNIHLKEIETQNAAEKLLARAGIKMSDLPADTSKFGGYREAEDSDDPDTIDEKEKSSGFALWTSLSNDREVYDDELHEGES